MVDSVNIGKELAVYRAKESVERTSQVTQLIIVHVANEITIIAILGTSWVNFPVTTNNTVLDL